MASEAFGVGLLHQLFLLCRQLISHLQNLSVLLLQLLELLRKCKLRARLRSARQRMHGLFPFNETQWMDWVNDEMETISSQEDIDRIKQLFQLATQDYMTVTIWESYLE